MYDKITTDPAGFGEQVKTKVESAFESELGRGSTNFIPPWLDLVKELENCTTMHQWLSDVVPVYTVRKPTVRDRFRTWRWVVKDYLGHVRDALLRHPCWAERADDD